MKTWALVFLASLGAVGCGTAALPQNGAFALDDACDRVVLAAIGEHPELRWVQRHSTVSGPAFLDAAEGFSPAENVQPTRRWTRYHSAEVGMTGPDKDVLTGLVWETDPMTLQRKPRTEYVTMDCPE